MLAPVETIRRILRGIFRAESAPPGRFAIDPREALRHDADPPPVVLPLGRDELPRAPKPGERHRPID